MAAFVAPLIYSAIGALGAGGAATAAVGRDRDEEHEDFRADITGADPYVQRVRRNAGLSELPQDFVVRKGTGAIEREASALDRVADFGVDIASAVPAIGRSAAGLANLPFAPFGAAPFEGIESTLGDFAEDIRERGFSDERLREEEAVRTAADGVEGFWNKAGASAGAVLENPAVAVGMLPEMLLGLKGAGALTKPLLKAASPLTRAAVAEGTVTGGSMSADIGAQTDDETRRLLGIPGGAITTAISLGGGSLITRMARSNINPIKRTGDFLNATDPDVFLTTGTRGAVDAKFLPRVAGGAVREGILEEAPQSAQEAMLTNLALGRDLGEGVAEAVGQGTAMGGLMGGAFNLPGNRSQVAAEPDATPDSTDPTPEAPSAIAELVKPHTLSGTLWEPRLEQMGAMGSKAEFETAMKDKQGFGKDLGDKRSALLRETEWYKSLPETTQETTEDATTAQAETTIEEAEQYDANNAEVLAGLEGIEVGEVGDVDWDGILDKEDAIAAQIEADEAAYDAELGNEPAPKEGTPPVVGADGNIILNMSTTDMNMQSVKKDKRIPTKANAPGVTHADIKAKPRAERTYEERMAINSELRGLYRAISGFIDGGTAAGRTMRGGGKFSENTMWKRITNATKKTVGEDVRKAVGTIHLITARLDKLNKDIGHVYSGAYISVDEAGDPKILIMPESDPDPVTGRQSTAELLATAPGVEGNFSTNYQDTIDALRGQMGRNNDALRELFDTLEARVGRTTLRNMMAVNAETFHNSTRKAAPGQSNLNAESSETIRFKGAYRRYRDGSLGVAFTSPAVSRVENVQDKKLKQFNAKTSTEAIANQKAKEDAALARKEKKPVAATSEGLPHNGAGKTRAPLPEMFRMMTGGMRPVQERGANPPDRSYLEDILMHYHRTSTDPGVAKVTGQLLFTLEKLGLTGADSNAKLNVVLHNSAGADNDAPASFARGADGEGATINIYGEGAHPLAVIHEALHAVTFSAIFNGRMKAPTKNLGKIVDFMVTHKEAGGFNDASPQLMVAVDAILNLYADPTSATSARSALSELVSYGFMNREFIDWMNTTSFDKTVAETMSPKNTIWRSFVIAIKRIVGASSVPNSVFENFLNESALILKEVEANKADPFLKRSTAAQNKEKVTMFMSATLEDQQNDPAKVALAEEAVATMNAGEKRLKQAAIDSNKAKKDKKAQQKKEAAEAVGPAMADINAKRAITHVPITPGQAPARDITRIDAAARNLAGTLPAVFGKGRDYEAFMQTQFGRAGNGIINWVSGQDTPTKKLLGPVLANMVDKFGVSEKALQTIDQMKGNVHEGAVDAVIGLESMVNMSEQSNQALLTYLQDENRDALVNSFSDATDPVKLADLVVGTVKSLRKSWVEAQANGSLPPEMIGIELLDAFAISSKESIMLSKRQGVTLAKPSAEQFAAGNVLVKGVSVIDIYTKKGVMIDKNPAGKKFRAALRTGAGNNVIRVFVEEGISQADMDRLGFLFDHTNPDRFRSRGKEVGGEYEMTRRKTVAERADKEVAASLLAFAYNLNKTNAYTRMVTEMASAEGADAYISDIAPTDLAGGATARIIDLTDVNIAADKVLAAARIPGAWVKIPDTEAARSVWGPLAGKYVAGPVYASLGDYQNPKRVIESDTFHGMLRVWKKNKTVWSVGTHVQNVGGNFILMYGHDIPMSNVKDAFRIVMGTVFPNSFLSSALTPQQKALMDEFIRSGATLGDQRHAELDPDTMKAINGFLGVKKDGEDASPIALMKGLAGLETVMIALRKGDTVMGDLYSSQDNVFRLAAYMTHIQRNAKADGTVDVATKEAAARWAKKAFVDYDISAPWINNLRGSVTPFLAWTYRMIPLMTKMAIMKPWKAGAMLGTIHALNAASYALLGMDADDEAEERALLDEYMQADVWGLPGIPVNMRLPFGDADPAFFGIGGFVPLAGIFELQNDLPKMAALSGPLWTAAELISNHQNFMDAEIRDAEDPTTTQLADAAKYFFNATAPNVLVNPGKFVGKHVYKGGTHSPVGNEPALWADFSRNIFGMNVRQVNMDDQVHKQSASQKRIKRDFMANLRQRQRNELRYANPDYDMLDAYLIDNQDRMQEALLEDLE